MDGFIVYLNLVSNNTHLQQVGLPGVSSTLPGSITLDSGLRLVIWTLAPSYTVMRNDVATLDVMAGIRYTSLRVSIAYEPYPVVPRWRSPGKRILSTPAKRQAARQRIGVPRLHTRACRSSRTLR